MFVIALSLFTGCTQDVGKDKVDAIVTDVRVEAKAKPTATGETWKVDTGTSSIRAMAAKVVGKHPIDFKTFKGTVKVDGDTVTGVAFTIDMPTLEADDPKLTAHLLDDEFFDVKTHPTSTFTSSSVTAGSKEKGFTHTITGVFSIHGTSKEITFPATVAVKDAVATARTEFVLDRKDFGLTYPGMADNAIQDNVLLTVNFTAKK